MILRRLARPRAIVNSAEYLPQRSVLQVHQRRHKHDVPALGDASNTLGILFEEHGVPGFLTPRTYRQTWQKYQKHLCETLNEHTAETDYANMSTKELHIQLSRQPDYAEVYNTAAMAHFNHLWWESLSMTKMKVPAKLEDDIQDQFGGLDSLRYEMLAHAHAIFGNGFVWLLKDNDLGKQLRILCTYNAGSPYSAAYKMRQDTDRATNLNIMDQFHQSSQMRTVQNTAGSAGMYSQANKDGFQHHNALNGHPLLCLNVWQHMWLEDYGILGRKDYLTAWWERINWDVVYRRSLVTGGASRR